MSGVQSSVAAEFDTFLSPLALKKISSKELKRFSLPPADTGSCYFTSSVYHMSVKAFNMTTETVERISIKVARSIFLYIDSKSIVRIKGKKCLALSNE